MDPDLIEAGNRAVAEVAGDSLSACGVLDRPIELSVISA